MTSKQSFSSPALLKLMNFAGAGRRRVQAYVPAQGVNFRAYVHPTSTPTTTMGGSSYSWNDTSGAFSIPDGKLVDANFGGAGVSGMNNVTGTSATVKTGYTWEADFRCPSGGGTLELVVGITNFSTVEDMMVLIDDQPVDYNVWMGWGAPDSGGVTKLVLQWDGAAFGNIRVLMGSAVLATIRMTANFVIRRPAPRRKAIVIADSTWAGNQPGGADGNVMAGTLHGRVSALTCWSIYNLSQAGTGVKNVLASASNGETVYGSSSRRAGWQAITDKLDLIIVQATANDIQWYAANTGATNLQSIQDGYAQLFAMLAADKPGVPIVVAGVQSASKQGTTQQETDVNNAARTAALSARGMVRYVDEIGQQWLTGTGNSINPQGTNRDLYVGNDDLHPTRDAGNEWRARRFLNSLEVAA